ncbi:MAG: hypothetical protein QF824_01810 [Candidatus Woesearchaeota archaeon]|jgi:hypothetical protein|nr:hypothetical protein [Candidatus Woesearchaeota archaeon]
MSSHLGACVGAVAPYYNLVLVLIVVILFIKLFKTPNKKAYILPWKFLFFSILVFIVEEIFTVLDMAGVMSVSKIVFPLLEMVIITSFIYMVLIQKDYVKNKK